MPIFAGRAVGPVEPQIARRLSRVPRRIRLDADGKRRVDMGSKKAQVVDGFTLEGLCTVDGASSGREFADRHPTGRALSLRERAGEDLPREQRLRHQTQHQVGLLTERVVGPSSDLSVL